MRSMTVWRLLFDYEPCLKSELAQHSYKAAVAPVVKQMWGGIHTRGCLDFWWNFKTFISKLHNLFPSQSIFNLKAHRWAQ